MTDSASPAPAPVKPKKPLWRRLLKWTLRVVILLVVLGLAAYAGVTYWAAKTINAEIARIRAAGEPLTFADLGQLTPQVADRAQDAGPYYAAACELVQSEFDADDANHEAFYGPRAVVPVPPEILARAHRDLDQNRIPLELLDRGSALPGCSWDIQLEYGLAVSFTHFGKPRALLNSASLRTRVLAVEGHGDQAVDSVISSLGLPRMMERQPVLIDALVQIAMFARACTDAAIAMDTGHPSEAALGKLNDALRQAHFIEPRRMLLAERVYYLETMRYLIADSRQPAPDGSDGPAIPERDSWTHLGLVGRVWVAQGLPTYARYVTAASGDWPAIMTNMQHVTDTPANIWDKVSGLSFNGPMVTYARGISIYRSTLIALQIERFRRAHNGALPDSLDQLPGASDLPMDPFTGKPFLFVKVADGYCVFSAGRGNPQDDSRHIDRDQDPVAWSQRWGAHIRTTTP